MASSSHGPLAGERTITTVVARGEATEKLAWGPRIVASFSPEYVLLVHVG